MRTLATLMILAIFLIVTTIVSSSSLPVSSIGGHAGYYPLPHSRAARMFYIFFESNKRDDPVVIWLSGGPGCGSEIGLFLENGPVQLVNMSLVRNYYGWHKASNLLYVDQPIGTGFSFTSDPNDFRHDEEGISNDLYDFLQAFFKEHHSLAKNPFYITGESYAGHYIPPFASRIRRGNKAKHGLHINLKGIAIGNGMTNPEIQYKAYTDYALQMKLISRRDQRMINKELLPDCEQSIRLCGSRGGTTCYKCDTMVKRILNISNVNGYDVRNKCKEGSSCYHLTDLEMFLNQKSVRDSLGVGDVSYVSCSDIVSYVLVRDKLTNQDVWIPDLLEDGIKVLIYAGEHDFMCNWLGNWRWVKALKWSGKERFGASPTVAFIVDGAKVGELKSHGPLAFLKVHNAGHLVPMDQPKTSLRMLKKWIKGELAA